MDPLTIVLILRVGVANIPISQIFPKLVKFPNTTTSSNLFGCLAFYGSPQAKALRTTSRNISILAGCILVGARSSPMTL